MEKLFETLETLCSLGGVSGWEDEVRDYILERAMPWAEELRTDPMGNLMFFRRGAAAPAKGPVLLAAHMDEVGLIVTDITEEGNLRFDMVGGIDRRVLPGKRVLVGPERRPGVLGLKPIHLTTAEERQALPPVKDLYIDIGADTRAGAESLVRLGDPVLFDSDFKRFGDGLVKAKALDDRVGCAAMLELMEEELPCDCWFAFTVQEEVGCRGARIAARSLTPAAALILEGATAADLAGVTGAEQICRVGQGVVIPFMDGGTMYDRGLYGLLGRLAEENGIPWQTKTRIAGGTDASALQREAGGARVAAVSVAMRNIHSPACVARFSECADQMRLARLFLGAMAGEPA